MGTSISVARAGLEQLETCLEIRREVFVRGQQIPEEIELDGLDSGCVHVLARLEGAAVGTARLREVDGCAKAERVAVLARERGLGLGRALMDALEAEARRQRYTELILNAQEEVVPFYERLGYTACGPSFLEAGILHRAMTKDLASH